MSLGLLPPAHARLWTIIETRHSELKKYAERHDAREGYLKKENAHIQALNSVALDLNEDLKLRASLRFLNLWVDAEAHLVQMIKNDPTISGLQIIVRLRLNGSNLGLLTYNPAGI